MLRPDEPLVALCRRCAAPLTFEDLGYSICLNCHWQDLFDYAAGEPGELRIALYAARPGRDAARDSAGRSWRRFAGDGQTWCVLCGEIVPGGWTQGVAPGPQIHLCADHVEWRYDNS